MPNTNESFDQVEAVASPEHAVNVVKFESAQSDSAPRRRRGGRRVVRGVGAAGASLELKVEEHAATPLFEEPMMPVTSLFPVMMAIPMVCLARLVAVIVRPGPTMMFVRLPMSSRRVLVAAARCRSRMSGMRIVRVAVVVPLEMRMSMTRCRVVAVAALSMISAMRNRLKNARLMRLICCRKAMRSVIIRVR